MANKKTAAKKAATTNAPKAPLSLFKAAIAVLEGSDEAMTCKELVEKAKAKNLWTPGAGKTPEQTLYSAIARDIKNKGEASRWRAAGHGHFKLATAN